MAAIELKCDKCSKPYTHPKNLAKHAMKCQGKPARSGRIKQPKHAERTPPAAKRSSSVPRKGSPYASAIADLETKRAAALTEADKYASAIAALEELA